MLRRLAGVSQLGFISLVYPTATHSRFEHVLGTFTNVLRYCDTLYNDALNPLFKQIMTEQDIVAVLLAALLHDLGQYALAHDLQEASGDMFEHEGIAIGILNGEFGEAYGQNLRDVIRRDWGVEPERVAKIIGTSPNKLDLPIKDRILSTIISGPIDADKLDYLVRDSTNLNVPFGLAIDFKRLLQCLTVIYKAQDHKLFVALGIHEKGKVPAESVAFARYAMFGTVYWHHTSRAAKAMLHRAVWEGLPQRTQRGTYKNYRTQLIAFVLTGSRGEEQKELFDLHIAHEELSQVLPSDREIIDWLSQRTSEPGKRLLRMLIERQLFRRVLVLSEAKSNIWKKLLSIRERHHDTIIELQREVQKGVVEHILSGNFGEREERTALKRSHDAGDILVLIDVPTQRPGVEFHYNTFQNPTARIFWRNGRSLLRLEELGHLEYASRIVS